MKFLLDKYYEKTKGFYPFFKYCPKQYWNHYIKRRAYDVMGYEYNYLNPTTFNEKVRWLIYNEKPEIKSKLSDKILVKGYVAEKIGPNHTAELYGVWNNFDEIDFSCLPTSFALKANHGWKMNIIVKNKRFIYNNYKGIRRLTNEWLKINYEHYSLEPQYRDIKRKLFAEYLRFETIGHNTFRCDFKVHCFNEKPLFIEIPFYYDKESTSFYHDFQFYNTNWELQPFSCISKVIDVPLKKPEFLEEMLEYAKVLCKGFSYVRVDFAPCKDNLHVCEMSFTPHSAMMPFVPANYDYILGEMLKIQ